MEYLNLNVDKSYLSKVGKIVLNPEEDLVLEVFEHTAFMSLKGRNMACLIFYERDDLYAGDSYPDYQDEKMIVIDHDSNVEITFFAQNGTFGYVIEKSGIDLPFHFELGGKNFRIGRNVRVTPLLRNKD